MATKRLLPSVPQDLLEHLEDAFRDTCPEELSPVEELYRKQGELRVVRHLRRLFDKQNETIYNKKG